MSDIHYFQRYTTKENAATNNTLHLFGRIYEYSPARLRALFTQMFEQDDIDLGVTFKQQVRGKEQACGKGSIPDGAITQSAIHIAIETKITAEIDVLQLQRHLEGLPQSGRKFLLLLTQTDERDAVLERIQSEAIKRGSFFRHLTFSQLCELLNENVKEYELNIRPIIDDYVAYCDEMGLGKNRQKIMRVVPCGPSHPLNERYNLYFHPQDRDYTPFKFLGIYYNKSVRLIGEVIETLDTEIDSTGTLLIRGISGKPISDSIYSASIRACMRDAQKELALDMSQKLRFFFVPAFFRTNYAKNSPGGIMGPRNHDVSEKNAKSAEQLAQLLNGDQWK